MKKNEAKSVEALHAGANMALKKAVAKALEQHASAGVPAAVWQDGKVVYLPVRKLGRKVPRVPKGKDANDTIQHLS